MSEINKTVTANAEYANSFTLGDLHHAPNRHLAVVACMDTRIIVEDILGLKVGEANILRNAGAIVTEDVMRSLIVSHKKLGAMEVMIMGHTECGAASFVHEEFVEELVETTGKMAATPQHFLDILDLTEHVKQQVMKVRSHPWMDDTVLVRGFLYDVKTGKLKEIDV